MYVRKLSSHLFLIFYYYYYSEISNVRIVWWTIIPLKIFMTPRLVNEFMERFSSYMRGLRSSISFITFIFWDIIIQMCNHPLNYCSSIRDSEHMKIHINFHMSSDHPGYRWSHLFLDHNLSNPNTLFRLFELISLMHFGVD